MKKQNFNNNNNRNNRGNNIKTPKLIPTSAARALADRYAKDEVLILAWDKMTDHTTITTYYSSDGNSDVLKVTGNKFDELLNNTKETKDKIAAPDTLTENNNDSNINNNHDIDQFKFEFLAD